MGLPAAEFNRDLPPSFKNKFTPEDFRFFKLVAHPTQREDSIELTKRMLEFLAKNDIVTSAMLQETLGVTEDPILKRLKVFREFKMVKRERNKYYRVTPRLHEVVRLYMDKL